MRGRKALPEDIPAAVALARRLALDYPGLEGDPLWVAEEAGVVLGTSEGLILAVQVQGRMEFDVVIIGGGSAGCVLAGRLSEDPGLSVLLIEAGGGDGHPFTRIPAASGQAIFNRSFNWMYQLEPDSSRTGQPEMWPAGKVLAAAARSMA